MKRRYFSSTRMQTCVLCFTVSLLSMGCGGEVKETIPDLVPVSGKVTFQGQPLPDALVQFLPSEGEEEATELNRIYRPAGRTNAAGEYELAWGENAGAPPGKYVVVISATRLIEDPTDPADQIQESLIPAQYNDRKNSGLAANVKESGDNDAINFDLQ